MDRIWMKVFRQWMLGWAGRLAERADPGANGKADFKVQKERWQNSKAALHGNGLAPGPTQTGLCAQDHRYLQRKRQQKLSAV
tara:strand:- start:95 stop:340 length:246 start_codon:yes stop_codon:yes gene_type:complete